MAIKDDTVYVRATLALRIIKAGCDKGFWPGVGAGVGLAIGVSIALVVADGLAWVRGLLS